jgi:hypothetical protein
MSNHKSSSYKDLDMPDTLTSASPSSLATPMPRAEAFKLTRTGRIADVLDQTQTLQAAFERGEIEDTLVARSLSAFSAYRPELTEILTTRADQFRSEYASQLAAGMHFSALGGMLRTNRRGRDIPEGNLNPMVESLERASNYLLRARQLTRQPSLSYSELQRIGTTLGRDPWDTYIEGVQRCPGSMLIRERMLMALRAEWGGKGDFNAMKQFLARPEHQLLSSLQRRRLVALELAYEAHHVEHFQKDPVLALELYRSSLEVQPTTAGHIGLVDRSVGLREADEHAGKALALNPNEDIVRTLQGLMHAAHGRSRYGLKLLFEARRWGDPAAQDILGNPAVIAMLRLRAVRRLGF